MRLVAEATAKTLAPQMLLMLLLLWPSLVPADSTAGCSHPWQMDLEVLFKGDPWSSGPRRNMIGLADEDAAQVLLTFSSDGRLGLKSSASFNTEAETASLTGRLARHRWVQLTLQFSIGDDDGDKAWTLLLDGVPSARASATAPPSLSAPLKVTWLLEKSETSMAVRNTFVRSGCNGTTERLNGGPGWPYLDGCLDKSNSCPAGCHCRATDVDNVCSCPKAAGCVQERYSLLFTKKTPTTSFDVHGDDVKFSSISGVTLTEGANYLTLRPQGRCFSDAECLQCGFYVRLVFKISLGHQDFSILYAGTLGLSLEVDARNRLVASLVARDADQTRLWTAAGGAVAENEWSVAEIAWHPELGGFRLLLNGRTVGQSSGPGELLMSAQTKVKDWYLGRDAAAADKPVVEEKQLTILSLLLASTDKRTLLAAQNDSSLGGPVHMVSVPFESGIESGYMMHFSFPAGIRVEDGVQRVPGVFGLALRLPGSITSFAKIQAGHSCLTDLQWCRQGITVRLWLRPLGGAAPRGESVLLWARGYEIVLLAGRLAVRARTDESVWASRGQRLSIDEWQLVEFTWEKRQGLQVYINGSLVDSIAIPTAIPAIPAATAVLSVDTGIYLGSAADMHGKSSPKCDIDELQLWEATRDELIARRKLTLAAEPNAYIWDDVSRHRFVGGTATPSVQAVVRGYPRAVSAPQGFGTGLRMSLDRDSIMFNENIVCLGDPLNYCPEGFAIVLPLKFEAQVSNMPIISSDSLQVSADTNRLIVQFQLSWHIWKATLPTSRLPVGAWFVMSISWQLHEGLLVYINDALVTAVYQAGLQDARDTSDELIIGSNPRLAYTSQVMQLGTVTWWNSRYSYVLNRAALRMRNDYPAVNIIDGPGGYQNQQPSSPDARVERVRIGRSGQIVYRFSGVSDNFAQTLNLTFATRERNALLWYSFREPNTTIIIFLKDGNLHINYQKVEDTSGGFGGVQHVSKSEITVRLTDINIADGLPHTVLIKKQGDKLDVRIDRRDFERHQVSNEHFWLVPDRGTVYVAEHRDQRDTPGFVGDISGVLAQVGTRLSWDLLDNIGGRNPRPDIPYTITGDVRVVYTRPTVPDRGGSGGGGSPGGSGSGGGSPGGGSTGGGISGGTSGGGSGSSSSRGDGIPRGGTKTSFTVEDDKLTMATFDRLNRRIEIEFLTNEPRGVLFYSGYVAVGADKNSFLLLEIFDGVFYLVVCPPAIEVVKDERYRFRLSAEGQLVNDMRPHKVRLWMDGRRPAVEFEGVRKILGDESRLDNDWRFNTYTYISFDTESRLPFLCWSRVRFHGCINYIMTGDDSKPSAWFYMRQENLVEHQADVTGRKTNCHRPRMLPCDVPVFNSTRHQVDLCFITEKNGPTSSETCSNRWRKNHEVSDSIGSAVRSSGNLPTKNFFCDCRHTRFTRSTPDDNEFSFVGAPCIQPAPLMTLDGSERYFVARFRKAGSHLETHHDDISIRFKTSERNGCLFKAFRMEPNIFLEAYLEDGSPVIATNMHRRDDPRIESSETQVLRTTRAGPRVGYNDDRWHTLIIKRRANYLAFYVDDDRPGMEFQKVLLEVDTRRGFVWQIDSIDIGGCNLATMTGPFDSFYGFKGELQNFHWLTPRNLYDLFRASKRFQLEVKIPDHMTTPTPAPTRPSPPEKPESEYTLTFLHQHQFSRLSSGAVMLRNIDEKGFTMELSFRTKDNSAVLVFINILQETEKYFGLELYEGRLRYSFNLKERYSENVPHMGQLNDDRWHRVWLHIFTPNRYGRNQNRMYFVVDDVNIEGPSVSSMFTYQGEVYLGGVADSIARNLGRYGFRSFSKPQFSGCMASVVFYQTSGHIAPLNGAYNLEFEPSGSVIRGSVCQLMRCADQVDFCSNGGTCRESADGRLECVCPAGIGGERCEQRPECPSNYCNGRGACDCQGRYPCTPRCVCEADWSGDRCQYRVTCPDSSRCRNGGTCTCDGSGPSLTCSPRCRCLPGFTGIFCETELRCDPSLCQNGGICYCDPVELARGRCVTRCRCRTFYSGDYCENFNCNVYLNQCNGRGTCNCRSEVDCRCNCRNGYTGLQCEQQPEQCDGIICGNFGFCRVINGQRSCDCSRSGYLADGMKCSRPAEGFLISGEVRDLTSGTVSKPTPGGYYVLQLPSPRLTDADNVTIGFQTYNKANTSTLLTFNGTNAQFWNLELDDGELKLNHNSVRYSIRLPNSVNLADGTLHTIYLEREGNSYRVFVNGTYLTRFSTSGQGFPYHQIIFGADPRGGNIFYGTVGNLKWNGAVYDRSQLPDSGRRPTYDHVTPLPLPANLVRPPTCRDSPGYCANGGICREHGIWLACDCVPPYYGTKCTNSPWGIHIRAENNKDSCAIMRVSSVPTGSDGSSRTESFRFGFQTFQSTAVLVTVYNRKDQFWQLFLRDGRVHLRDSFSRDSRLVFYSKVNDGAAHTIVGSRDDQSLSFFLDGEGGLVDRYSLNQSLFVSGGQFEHGKLEFGAGNYSDGPGRPEYTLCFLGAIGGIEWNGLRPIDDGNFCPNWCGTWPSTVRPIPFPTTLPIYDFVNPDLGGGGLLLPNGGYADVGTGPAEIETDLFYPGSNGEITAVGAGAVVMSGTGGGAGGGAGVVPGLAAAGFGVGAVGGLVNAWIAGLLLALLLLLSSILWACCHCKPGYYLCCAKGSGWASFAQFSAVKNQFGSAIGGRKKRSANGGGATATDGALNLDIAQVDRSTLDTRMQLQGTTDVLSIRSGGGGGAMWSRYEHTVRQEDAMSDAYRPRQTYTIGRDKVLDLTSNYQIETMGAVETGARTQENVYLSENIKVDCALITQNSRYVVTGNAAGSAQVWDCVSGDLIKVMDGRDIGCTEIHLACEDSVLLGLVLDEASGRHRLQMWDFAHGRQVAMPYDVFCSTVTVNKSGAHAVVASLDSAGKASNMLVWDIRSNQVSRTLPLPPVPGLTDVITYLRVSREDQYVVAGFPNSASGMASYLVYDLGAPVSSSPLQVDFDAVVHCTELGAGEAVTGTAKGELLVWALATGHVERPICQQGGAPAHQSAIKAVSWSADGRVFASGGADFAVHVWDMTNESLTFALEGHTDDVQSICISVDAEILVSGSWDGSIRVWKLKDGSQLCWFTSNIDIFKVILSRDKRCVVGLGERANNRKLIMLQIIRQKSRRTRSRGQSDGQAIVEP